MNNNLDSPGKRGGESSVMNVNIIKSFWFLDVIINNI